MNGERGNAGLRRGFSRTEKKKGWFLAGLIFFILKTSCASLLDNPRRSPKVTLAPKSCCVLTQKKSSARFATALALRWQV
jgi:hypothetical protein